MERRSAVLGSPMGPSYLHWVATTLGLRGCRCIRRVANAVQGGVARCGGLHGEWVLGAARGPESRRRSGGGPCGGASRRRLE